MLDFELGIGFHYQVIIVFSISWVVTLKCHFLSLPYQIKLCSFFCKGWKHGIQLRGGRRV